MRHRAVKLALISDVHGNLVALLAALAAIERHRPDVLVCLGDVAASGPRPGECIQRLAAAEAQIVQGNSDAWLCLAADHAPPSAPYPEVQEIDAWCRAQLEREELALLDAYPPHMRLPLSAGEHLFACHGSPRSFDEPIRATTPEHEVDAMTAGIGGGVLAAGHTHQSMVRRHRNLLLVNPGSVGMPLEYRLAGGVRYPPWVEYALLTEDAGALAVTLQRVPLDVAAVVRDARASGMPHAEFWVEPWLA